jgi:hypothetical protein
LHHLVVRVRSTTKDTEVATLMTNRDAVKSPCLVMDIVSGIFKGPRNVSLLNVKRLTMGSPGTNTLKIAGRAIIPEKRGIKSHTLTRKKRNLILEKYARKRVKRYTPKRRKILLYKLTVIINSPDVRTFTLGSIDCSSPFFEIISSEKSQFRKKEVISLRVFST